MAEKTSSKKKPTKVTPLMQQYFRMKAQHPDAILLFRVGDFYETFGEDAVKASQVLNIHLTSRNNGGSDVELAGFPHHALDTYLPKLVKGGFRVAICEQLEKPSKQKKVVKRGVTEIVTPGLTTNDKLLDHKSNNFLAALHFEKQHQVGLAFLDLSTGEFLLSEGDLVHADNLIQSFLPNEIIFAKSKEAEFQSHFGQGHYTYSLDPWIFTIDFGREKLLQHFDVPNLKGYGIEEIKSGQAAAGAILHYLAATENSNVKHITQISRIEHDQYVWLDRFTARNLELLHPTHPEGTPLIRVLDETVSPMGGRLLKKWVALPLKKLGEIKDRQAIVAYFIDQPELQEQLRASFRKIGDIERLVSKVPLGKITPREVNHIRQALAILPTIKGQLEQASFASLTPLADKINPCPSLFQTIQEQLVEEPANVLGKGKVIADGFSPELDEFRHIIANGRKLMLDLNQREAEKTGIGSLKVGFNNVFGFYFEVTNKYKNLGLIPDNWVRKQTLTNSERYISEELKELEDKILHAEEKGEELEARLFSNLIERIAKYIQPMQINAGVIAHLDCLLGFSVLAIRHQYIQPEVNMGYVLDIRGGRHPVIEQLMPPGEAYVPNSVFLDNEQQQILMITGPNMAGKSALLRQTALICLMAQIGSFVPATFVSIGLIDKVFTRVGASDNISSGESTFMVEMNETASIMNNISERSLILLDELGRGTSTYDGISIAWSIAEFLHTNPIAHPKTLFATHYHELNELANKLPRIKNFHIATKEVGQKVIFLRQLREGGSQHSFGIHVAKMAGMPKTIVDRANEILAQLEQKSIQGKGELSAPDLKNQLEKLPAYQLSIFETVDPLAGQLKEAIQNLDLNSMTPIDCMIKLHELMRIMDEQGEK